MRQFTIYMAIFNSKLLNYQRVQHLTESPNPHHWDRKIPTKYSHSKIVRWMGQGNPAGPAPPKGWLKLSKPKQNHGISHRFQLVQDFAGPSTVSPSNPIRYLLISLALMVDMALLLHPNMSNIYICWWVELSLDHHSILLGPRKEEKNKSYERSIKSQCSRCWL